MYFIEVIMNVFMKKFINLKFACSSYGLCPFTWSLYGVLIIVIQMHHRLSFLGEDGVDLEIYFGDNILGDYFIHHQA